LFESHQVTFWQIAKRLTLPIRHEELQLHLHSHMWHLLISFDNEIFTKYQAKGGAAIIPQCILQNAENPYGPNLSRKK
jgi:hypothetical protein